MIGILLIEVGLPILEGLVNLFLTIFECWKSKLSVKITESNMKMKMLAAETDKNASDLTEKKVYQIGFTIPEEEEEEDEVL